MISHKFKVTTFGTTSLIAMGEFINRLISNSGGLKMVSVGLVLLVLS